PSTTAPTSTPSAAWPTNSSPEGAPSPPPPCPNSSTPSYSPQPPPYATPAPTSPKTSTTSSPNSSPKTPTTAPTTPTKSPTDFAPSRRHRGNYRRGHWKRPSRRAPGRRRGPESVLRVGLWAVLTCIVAAALVYISFLVAVINPGGVLVDQGAFAEAPSCSDIRPAAFSTPESEGGLEGGISCEWRIKGEPFRSVVVSLGVVETNGWTSAVKEARKRMAKPVLARDSVRREEPALGPDAYSAMSRDRPDKHQVVFRKSNLIVSVHYNEDHGLGDDPDPADMRATTLKLAAEIQSKINA